MPMGVQHHQLPGPWCPRWGPLPRRKGKPWFLHYGPRLHEVVSATVAGHSCPPGCQKAAEIEAFLAWWGAQDS